MESGLKTIAIDSSQMATRGSTRVLQEERYGRVNIPREASAHHGSSRGGSSQIKGQSDEYIGFTSVNFVFNAHIYFQGKFCENHQQNR